MVKSSKVYIAVMHSGVTNAPIAGKLGIEEIISGKQDWMLNTFSTNEQKQSRKFRCLNTAPIEVFRRFGLAVLLCDYPKTYVFLRIFCSDVFVIFGSTTCHAVWFIGAIKSLFQD